MYYKTFREKVNVLIEKLPNFSNIKPGIAISEPSKEKILE